jgi:AhpD family alkylhydroperoxidase
MTSTDTTTRFEEPRLELGKHARGAYRAMIALDGAIEFDKPLGELVRLRASMLNGCAYCVDMHTRDAREAGETEQRLYAVAAWHEAPWFTDRERAALALTDAVTLVAEGHVPREVWDEAGAHFDEEELTQLLWTITAINAWNRVAVATRMMPGT